MMSHNVPGTASLFAGEVWSWDVEQQGCVDVIAGSEGVDATVFSLREEIWVSGLLQATVVSRPLSALPSESKLLAPGPLPGVAAAFTVPVTGTAHLGAWLHDYLSDGEPFIWIHAPACYALTHAQLDEFLSEMREAGALSCTPVAPVLGFSAERCGLISDLSLNPTSGATFGGQVDLLAVVPNSAAQAPDALTVRLRWLPRVNLGDLDLYLALTTEGDGGQIVWAEGGRQLVDNAGRPTSAWQPERIFDTEGYIPLPLELPPGTYSLVLRVAGSDGWMGVTYADGNFGGVQIGLGLVRIDPPPYPAPVLALPSGQDRAWPGLRVVGAGELAGEVGAGKSLPFSLGLERTAGATLPSLAWSLDCGGSRVEGGVLSWPLDAPSSWPGGHRYVVHFAPRLDPGVAAGACRVWVAPEPGNASFDPQAVLVGEIQVVQRERIFEILSEPEIHVQIAAGDFARLHGADLSTHTPVPGEPLTVALYWEAVAIPSKDYTVFVHLVGPDGQVWGQSDAAPAGGGAATMTWLPGEVVEDVHSLTLRADAPEGTYRLYAGLYDAQSGLRVPLYEGERRLPDARTSVVELQVVR